MGLIFLWFFVTIRSMIKFVLVGFLGAILGSFAGAQIWRLRARQLMEDKKAGEKVNQKELKKLSPLIKKISKDRSRCLSCGHELKWCDLIPVVSWVAGLGRCRYCKAFIGWTEILLELVMAGLFVASVAFWPGSLTDIWQVALLVLWLASLVLLAILAFSFCLLGTFLVRSGILVSVHAFASDPTRGLYVLAYLIVVIGGSLTLYAYKGSQIRSRDNAERYSRESLLLLNNILLMTALCVVLLGTLLPLVHKQLGLGSISIGAPFFDQMFLIIMTPFALLLGIGPLVKWRRDQFSEIRTPVVVSVIVMAIAGFALPYFLQNKLTVSAVLGTMMSVIIVLLSLYEMKQRATHRESFFKGITKLSRSHWGMILAHLGVAMTVWGIAFSQNFSVERDVRMAVGDTVQIADYDFKFTGVSDANGPNYMGGKAQIDISKDGKPEAKLFAEKRFYTVSKMPMTEAAIDWGFTRDLYVALGEKIEDNSWALRLYYKPFIRWIWIGGLFMALGGLLCMFDRRYRFSRLVKQS